MIKFNQKAWLKPYIDMNTILRQKAKNSFEKGSFKLMNNAVFGETMENMSKHRLVTTTQRRNSLVSEPIYNTTKFFTENLLAIEMRKIQILMNKPVYLGLSILDLSKTVMYEFWYDDVKPNYGKNAKLCYVVTDSFIVLVKTDVETRLDTSNFEIHRLLPKGKIGVIKVELGRQIKKESFGLREKTYSYLKDNNNEDKKDAGTKKCVIKRKLRFQDYKDCSEAAQIERKINYLRKKRIGVDSLKEDQKEVVKNDKLIFKTQQRFKSERQNVFTEEINKIALSSNDDKRKQPIDLVEWYTYWTSKDLVSDKEEIKCNNIVKQYKNMVNFDVVVKEDTKNID